MKGLTLRFSLGTTFSLFAIICDGMAASQVAIPSITTHPTSRFVLIGSNVTFSVTAQNVSASGYQWFKDGQQIVGQTNPALVISNVQAMDRGFYHVLVQNAAAVVASQQAFLVPKTNLPDASGGAVLFNTSAIQSVTNFYFNNRLKGPDWVSQLYAAPMGSFDFAPIGFPQNFSLPGQVFGGARFIPSVPAGGQAMVEMRVWSILDGDSFEQAFANGGLVGKSQGFMVTTGTTGNPGALTAMQGFYLASLDGQRGIFFPRDLQTAVGGSATFSAMMTTCGATNCGTNLLAYEWRKNGIVIPGANASSLVLTNVDVADAATYTFTTGGIRSPAYALTVLLNPQFLSFHRLSPSDVRLRIRGATGSVIGLEASTNLLDWTSLAFLTNQSGVVEYIDSAATATPQQFYRTMSQ